MAFENLVLPKEIKVEQESATYGKFIAEPYESGLGHTVGNSAQSILKWSVQKKVTRFESFWVTNFVEKGSVTSPD